MNPQSQTFKEIRPSYAAHTPLRKGDTATAHASPCAYFYRYTTAPTTKALSDITTHEDVVGGLSRLDADCNLGKKIRKAGRFLHAVITAKRVK